MIAKPGQSAFKDSSSRFCRLTPILCCWLASGTEGQSKHSYDSMATQWSSRWRGLGSGQAVGVPRSARVGFGAQPRLINEW